MELSISQSFDSSPIAQEGALCGDRGVRVFGLWIIVKAKEPLNLRFNNEFHGKRGRSVKHLKIYRNFCVFVCRYTFTLGIGYTAFSDW